MATKPSGQIELNTSHALYAKIVALVVCEDDGTVRELITGSNSTGHTTESVGGDIGLVEEVHGLNLGADISPNLSQSAFTGTSEFSFAVFGAVPNAVNTLFGVGESNSQASGSYSSRLETSNWSGSLSGLRFKGGFSGNGPSNGNSYDVSSTVASLMSFSATITAGAWSTVFYEDGVELNTSTTALDGNNIMRAGNTAYASLVGVTTHPTLYGVIFDEALTTAEWAALAADPWDIVQGATPPATGTVTTEALKNNTGTVLANETGLIVDIYDVTSGALVMHLTGQTTDGSGIFTVTDVSLVTGTAYVVVLKTAANALGVDEITAT